MKVGDFKYKKVAAANTYYNDSSFRWTGIVFHIYALVSSKTGENLPGRDAKFTKQVKRIPKEVEGDITKENEVAALEAAGKGELWFIKVGNDKKGEGWMWSKGRGDPDPKGADRVPAIHEVLTWLQKFSNNQTVDGAKAFYLEINNNSLG